MTLSRTLPRSRDLPVAIERFPEQLLGDGSRSPCYPAQYRTRTHHLPQHRRESLSGSRCRRCFARVYPRAHRETACSRERELAARLCLRPTISAGRKSETTGTPTLAATTAASPVCHVAATLRPRKSLRLALMIKRLTVAADQIHFCPKPSLRGQHRIGIKFTQQEIQPSQIGHARPRGIHRVQQLRESSSGRGTQRVRAT